MENANYTSFLHMENVHVPFLSTLLNLFIHYEVLRCFGFQPILDFINSRTAYAISNISVAGLIVSRELKGPLFKGPSLVPF
jgi:hypothetical protein